MSVNNFSFSDPRSSGLEKLMGCTVTSRIAAYWLDTCVLVKPLRRPKPAQDEWYVIKSNRSCIKALAAYWGGISCRAWGVHLISVSGKSPTKLEVTSRHDLSCLLGRNASNQTKQIFRFRLPKITFSDCQNQYNGNRKRLVCVRRSLLWQSKMLYLAIVDDLPVNERSFAIAAYPMCLGAIKHYNNDIPVFTVS